MYQILINFVQDKMMMYIEEVTGKELKLKRRELGFTQEEMAEKLRVARNTIARWERDANPIPPFLDLAVETIERNFIESLQAQDISFDELREMAKKHPEETSWINEILIKLKQPPIERAEDEN